MFVRDGDVTTDVHDTDTEKVGVVAKLVNGHEKTKTPEEESSSFRKFRRRLYDDSAFRKKFIIFLCLCYNFLILGVNVGILGPTLLDLKLITNCTLDQVSFLFNAGTIGYLLSSVVVGILFDRYNKLMLMFVPCLCLSVVVAVLPWCYIYEVMVAVHVVKGFCMGMVDAVGNALMIHLLPDEIKTYMQVLHFMFAFGGIVAPIISAPFLSSEQSSLTSHTNLTIQLSFTGDNSSTLNYTTQSDILNNVSMFNNSSQPLNNVTEVYKGYTISAVLTLLSAISFLVVYCKSDETTCPTTKGDHREEQKETISLRLRISGLVILCVIIAAYTALEDTYAGFLTTFTVQHLKWSKAEGAFATSVFWALFAFGRFCGIFIVNLVGQVKLLFIYTFTIIAAFIVLLVTSLFFINAGIWISAVVVGVGMSIFFPIFFSWTEEKFFHVDGKVTSLIMACASLGVIINPIILARVMKSAPIWFVYIPTLSLY